jgi:hypothetical protein
MHIMIVWLTIVEKSNRLFLKIIAKSRTSEPESTKRNPSSSPFDTCACPPRNPSSLTTSWWPQPWYHATAPPRSNHNCMLTLTVLQPTAEIRRRRPALTMCTIVPNRSGRRGGPHCSVRSAAQGREGRIEERRVESSPLTWDMRWEKRGGSPLTEEMRMEKWGQSTIKRWQWEEKGTGTGMGGVVDRWRWAKINCSKQKVQVLKLSSSVTSPARRT